LENSTTSTKASISNNERKVFDAIKLRKKTNMLISLSTLSCHTGLLNISVIETLIKLKNKGIYPEIANEIIPKSFPESYRNNRKAMLELNRIIIKNEAESMLAAHGEIHVRTLSRRVGISVPTVYRHLKHLEII